MTGGEALPRLHQLPDRVIDLNKVDTVFTEIVRNTHSRFELSYYTNGRLGSVIFSQKEEAQKALDDLIKAWKGADETEVLDDLTC